MGRKYSAFTLIELLIAVVVIGLLVVMVITLIRTNILKGNDAKRKADLNRIKIAIEEYEKDHNCYPPPELLLCDPGTGLQPYLNKIPCDPVTGNSYVYDYNTTKTCTDWFRLYATLQNEDDLGDSGFVNFNGDAMFCITSPNAPSCQYEKQGSYYGCKNGVCVPIMFDKSLNKYECVNKFASSTCGGQCGNRGAACRPP